MSKIAPSWQHWLLLLHYVLENGTKFDVTEVDGNCRCNQIYIFCLTLRLASNCNKMKRISIFWLDFSYFFQPKIVTSLQMLNWENKIHEKQCILGNKHTYKNVVCFLLFAFLVHVYSVRLIKKCNENRFSVAKDSIIQACFRKCNCMYKVPAWIFLM